MKKIIITLLFSVLSFLSAFSQSNEEINFNFGWRFAKGDQHEAHTENFDDSEWRIVEIPHDWSIEDLDEQSGPFNESAEGSYDVGYTIGGIAWYRKTFTLDSTNAGKIIQPANSIVYSIFNWIKNISI